MLNALNSVLENQGESARYYQIIGLELSPVLTDNSKYNTAVTYSVAPTYTVTIPEKVTLGETATIKAEDVVVAKGKQVVVKLTETTRTTDTEQKPFAVKTNEGAEITYTVKDKNENVVSIGDTVLTVNPAIADNASSTLKFIAPDSVTYAGKYSGTVIFTVSVESV